MNKLAITTITAGALATAALGFAGHAGAVPAGPGSASATINSLQSSGYKVVVNKLGGGGLDHCAVAAVRPGQTYSKTDSGVPGAGNDVIYQLLSKTVYVDLNC